MTKNSNATKCSKHKPITQKERTEWGNALKWLNKHGYTSNSFISDRDVALACASMADDPKADKLTYRNIFIQERRIKGIADSAIIPFFTSKNKLTRSAPCLDLHIHCWMRLNSVFGFYHIGIGPDYGSAWRLISLCIEPFDDQIITDSFYDPRLRDVRQLLRRVLKSLDPDLVLENIPPEVKRELESVVRRPMR